MSLTVGQLISKLQTYDPNALVVSQSATRDGYERVSGTVRREVTHGYKDAEGNQQCNFLPVGHDLSPDGAPVSVVVLLQD
jgi:hypothetical protein